MKQAEHEPLDQEMVEDIEDEIEHASDDENPYNDPSIASRTRRQNRRLDSEYMANGQGENIENESDEPPMDDLEPEHISDGEDQARNKKSKESSKGYSRKHRTDIEDAQLEGEEQEETVFIDNLPNDENAIKAMLKSVQQHVRTLEQQFFDEENSDDDEKD